MSLKTFHVIDTLVVKLSSSYEQSMDSLVVRSTPILNLTDALQRRAGIPMKNYGPGLLSTPTFRGGDAQHTQVVWNGMKLNSPMLGSMDLSTIAASQFDQLSFMSGVASGLYTTGGMGSIIALQQSAQMEKEFAQLMFSGGSFVTYHAAARFNVPLKVFDRPAAFAFSADLQGSDNAYPYLDYNNGEWEKALMQNASFGRSNISLSLRVRATEHSEFEGVWWVSNTQRDVPNPINLRDGYALQGDDAQRLFIRWGYEKDKWRFAVRSMFEDNNNRFFIDVEDVNRNHFQTWQNQAEATYHAQRWLSFHARLGTDWIQGESLNNYPRPEQQMVYSQLAFARVNLWQNRIQGKVGGRAEQTFGDTRVLPIAGLRIKLMHDSPFSLISSYAQTVRFPTLNERFWIPGGVPDLAPEDGWTAEAGFEVEFEKTSLKAVAYQNRYKNRIRWLPSGSFFSPTNIDEARAQGIDVQFKHQISIAKWRSLIGGSYHFTQAEGRNFNESFTAMSFVPVHSAVAFASITRGPFSIDADYAWVDPRFITSDVSSYMPAYHLVTLGGSYTRKVGESMQLRTSLAVDNVTDWQYQNMPWRPMPGRAFHFKLILSWGDTF